MEHHHDHTDTVIYGFGPGILGSKESKIYGHYVADKYREHKYDSNPDIDTG